MAVVFLSLQLRSFWRHKVRRRQLFAAREQQLIEESEKMAVKVPNSNIISTSAPEALKDKYAMFAPEEKDIVKPNGSPYRKGGSKPGKGAANPTEKKNKY